jgi:hypothetical protein
VAGAALSWCLKRALWARLESGRGDVSWKGVWVGGLVNGSALRITLHACLESGSVV